MAIRRSEHYTVPDALFTLPEQTVYRDSFRELPLLQRLYLRFRTWFGSADIVTVVKEHELEEVKQRVVARDPAVADVQIPALTAGFHERVRAIARHARALKPGLSAARGTGAGNFLREALRQLDPQLHETITASTSVPEEVVTDPSVSISDAREIVLAHLYEALDINKKAIVDHLDAVWRCLESLAALAAVDYNGLIPAGDARDIRTPMRIVRQPLTQFACTVAMCQRNRHRSAARLAMDYAGRRAGKGPHPDDAVWQVIDDLVSTVPLVDLVRLAADEPRLTLAELSPGTRWWARFAAGWSEMVNPGPTLLRHRSMTVEDILRNHFGVEEPVVTWIPPSLYQRSVGALRRVVEVPRFRASRTMVGALAREQNLLPTSDRATILDHHVELDNVFARIEELFGHGNSRGAIGEELRRVGGADSDSATVGMHKVSIYSKYRPDVRILVGQAADALEATATRFDTHRRSVRRALKAGQIRLDLEDSDLPPVEIFDLVTESYRRLAVTVRSLAAMEHELATGGGTAAAGEHAEDGEADDDPRAAVAQSTEHRQENPGRNR